MRILHLLAQLDIDSSRIPKAGIGGSQDPINTALSIFFSITGSVAVLMITISGFKYVLSRGDPGAVSKAKDTILYAVVGLAVSILGFTIVKFVVNKI